MYEVTYSVEDQPFHYLCYTREHAQAQKIAYAWQTMFPCHIRIYFVFPLKEVAGHV